MKTITQVAEELEIPRERLKGYISRGYIGESFGGKGHVRLLTDEDIRAVRVALILTDKHRLLKRVGREFLYAPNEWVQIGEDLEVLGGSGDAPVGAVLI